MDTYVPDRVSVENPRWQWMVVCRFTEPPARKGRVAAITVHQTEFSKDMEVAAASRCLLAADVHDLRGLDVHQRRGLVGKVGQ